MKRDVRKPLLRLAIMFAWIPLAYLAGLAAQSVDVFIAVMALGLLVSVLLRFTVLR